MIAWPVLRLGSSGEDVRTMQYFLQAHGAHLPVVDGAFGPVTKAAVVRFQESRHMLPDGVVGGVTWEALLVAVARGSSGPAVRGLQSQLSARIGIPGRTGEFDEATQGLVHGFQRAQGLLVDGLVGQLTWRALVTGALRCRSADAAAKSVFEAWTRRDADLARQHATPAAADRLFARTWSSNDPWRMSSCDGAAGSFFCRWSRPDGELVLRCNNNAAAPFYYVEDATFTP